jgi:voltage-gated potassium channel
MEKRRLPQRSRKFVKDLITHTPIVKMIFLLLTLWMLFSAGLYFGERGADDTTITSYGKALYWGIAAFSTAGIADMPTHGLSVLIGGIWIIVGSMLFFGTIIATITAYFMRPLLRPANQLINAIEYNLEQLDDLSVDELELLKETVDTLIMHMERSRERRLSHTHTKQ